MLHCLDLQLKVNRELFLPDQKPFNTGLYRLYSL